MKQKDTTMVMGRRDGATAAAFGDRGMRGGKAGCADVFVQGLPVNSECYSNFKRRMVNRPSQNNDGVGIKADTHSAFSIRVSAGSYL